MRRSLARMAAALAVTVASFATGTARAADPPIVLEPKYQPRHEFRLSLGYLPQDPFWKGFGPDVSYTWHRSRYFSWEILRVGYYVHYDSELRNKLRSEFDAIDDPYEKAQYMLTSHAQFTPFYGRYSFLNRRIVHQELYFTGGGGLIGWTKPEDGSNGGGFRPTLDVGLGFRWYTSQRSSFKIEVLEQLHMRSDGSLGDQFYLTIGGSFFLNRPRGIQ